MKQLTLLALITGVFGCAVVDDRAGPGNSPDKSFVCHKGKTLDIAEPAVNAHVNHGDRRGAC